MVVVLLLLLLVVVVLVGLKRINTRVQRAKGGDYLGFGTGIGRGHFVNRDGVRCVVVVCSVVSTVVRCCCVVFEQLY